MSPRQRGRGRPQRLKSGGLAEDPWQRQVDQLAGFYGWLHYHTHDSRRSAAGFPDDVFVRDVELLFVELKTDEGKVSAAQRGWLEALERVATAVNYAAGLMSPDTPERIPRLEVHVWRPRDFDDVVHPRLARGRLRQEPIERR